MNQRLLREKRDKEDQQGKRKKKEEKEEIWRKTTGRDRGRDS